MRGGVHSQKGFTLVEIMMVVIIIGILAVLAIPRYQKYTLEAKLSEVAVSVGEIKTGEEKYYNSHGNVYASIGRTIRNASIEQILRIDLGGQENFEFDIYTYSNNAETGYVITAFLTQTGINRDYADVPINSRVIYFFPRTLNTAWDDPAWKKGWNDDDFFLK